MAANAVGRPARIACWTITEPSNAEQMLELTAALDAQRDIPGVVSVEHGLRTARVDWDGPDKAFDYAMVAPSPPSMRQGPIRPIRSIKSSSVRSSGLGRMFANSGWISQFLSKP